MPMRGCLSKSDLGSITWMSHSCMQKSLEKLKSLQGWYSLLCQSLLGTINSSHRANLSHLLLRILWETVVSLLLLMPHPFSFLRDGHLRYTILTSACLSSVLINYTQNCYQAVPAVPCVTSWPWEKSVKNIGLSTATRQQTPLLFSNIFGVPLTESHQNMSRDYIKGVPWPGNRI